MWLCRVTALDFASEKGHTETAMALVKAGADLHGKLHDNMGYGILLGSVGFPTVSGRTVRPLGTERQECLFWLCRFTALHFASQNGHTETALALVKAGADVHCKTNDGCGFSGCILVWLVLPRCGGGQSAHFERSSRIACLGCAG